MNTTYRLLINGQDNVDFETILNTYLVQEINRPHRVYPLSVTENFVKNNSNFFKTCSADEYVVSAGYVDGCISSFAIGIKMSLLLRPATKVPVSWLLNMVYISSKEWSSPLDRIHNLMAPLTKKMEEDRHYSFYKINKIPPSIDATNVKGWLETYAKTINNKKYIPVVEQIIRSDTDIINLPHLYRSITPQSISRPIAIMSHHLRSELRIL